MTSDSQKMISRFLDSYFCTKFQISQPGWYPDQAIKIRHMENFYCLVRVSAWLWNLEICSQKLEYFSRLCNLYAYLVDKIFLCFVKKSIFFRTFSFPIMWEKSLFSQKQNGIPINEAYLNGDKGDPKKQRKEMKSGWFAECEFKKLHKKSLLWKNTQEFLDPHCGWDKRENTFLGGFRKNKSLQEGPVSQWILNLGGFLHGVGIQQKTKQTQTMWTKEISFSQKSLTMVSEFLSNIFAKNVVRVRQNISVFAINLFGWKVWLRKPEKKELFEG